MNISEIHAGNAAFWNEIADTYSQGESGEADAVAFLRAGGNFLFDNERLILGNLAGWCRRAIHLQCSGGNDALSLLHQGAAGVVGIDISERLLAVARRKAEALGAPASFVRSDILDIPDDLDATADLVYTGKGALCWMMDMEAWARVATRLLKLGGLFFVHESHPLDWIWDTDATNYALDSQHGDYFSPVSRQRLFARIVQSAPQYRQWTLGEIVNGLIKAGLCIESLTEHPEPFWNQFSNMPDEILRRLPHTFTLTARKK